MSEQVGSRESDVAEGEERPTAERLYLDLLKGCLTRSIFGDAWRVLGPYAGWKGAAYGPLDKTLGRLGLQLHRQTPPDARQEGRDWPADAETMIGLKRLDNLEHCVTDVLREGVPGDLIETGVWRGGASIFMRAVLKAYGDTQRVVWLADSFQGLPESDRKSYPKEEGDFTWTQDVLAVSMEQVKSNFTRYGLFDDQVRFLPGWFRDTLPTAPMERLAVLRLDGDLYESTMVALESLYPKLSIGGYVIVDDTSIPNCMAALEDYRRENGITEEISRIDWTGVYWRRLT